jgi:hypothetical protein
LVLTCWVSTASAAPAIVNVASPASDEAQSVKEQPAKETKGAENGVGSQFELVFWQSVSNSEDIDQLEAYLAQYPSGTFSALARAKIAALQRQAGSVTAASRPEPPASQTAELAATPGARGAEADKPPAPTAPSTEPSTAAQGQEPPASPAEPKLSSAEAGMSPALAEQLRVLGESQREPTKPQAMKPQTTQVFAIPVRPQLASVPAVEVPEYFCSTADRHSFYETVYSPARRLADQNLEATTAHLLKLQAVYDSTAPSADQQAMDAVASELRDYQSQASDAKRTSEAFDAMFNRMVEAPIHQCPE